MLNCPNCGAPVQRDFCPYCGTVFLDWADFDLSAPTFVKIRRPDGKTVLVKLRLTSFRQVIDSSPVRFYADDEPYELIHRAELSFDASFVAVPFSLPYTHRKDVLQVLIDPETADPQTVSEIWEDLT